MHSVADASGTDHPTRMFRGVVHEADVIILEDAPVTPCNKRSTKAKRVKYIPGTVHRFEVFGAEHCRWNYYMYFDVHTGVLVVFLLRAIGRRKLYLSSLQVGGSRYAYFLKTGLSVSRARYPILPDDAVEQTLP